MFLVYYSIYITLYSVNIIVRTPLNGAVYYNYTCWVRDTDDTDHQCTVKESIVLFKYFGYESDKISTVTYPVSQVSRSPVRS